MEEYHFCTRCNRNIDGLDLWEAKLTIVLGSAEVYLLKNVLYAVSSEYVEKIQLYTQLIYGGRHGDKVRYMAGSLGSSENLILGSESGRKGALYDSFTK